MDFKARCYFSEGCQDFHTGSNEPCDHNVRSTVNCLGWLEPTRCPHYLLVMEVYDKMFGEILGACDVKKGRKVREKM